MFGSLRFRLPALFLLGILLAGLVASLISIRFFQSYTRRGRSTSCARSRRASCSSTHSRRARRDRSVRKRSSARSAAIASTGCRRFSARTFAPGIPDAAAESTVDMKQLDTNGFTTETISFRWQGKSYLAVAQPLKLGNNLFGALVVAKPTSQLRSRWVTLVERLGARASAAASSSRAYSASTCRGGSRSRCASCRWRRTRWPRASTGSSCRRSRGSDEISHLSARFARHGREARRVRAALAQLPDVGVARAADAADGDPRARVSACAKA